MEEVILRGPEIKLERKSFGRVFFESLKNGQNKIAMVNAANDEHRTYNDLLKGSLILAQYFQNNGLTKNDCVAICSENSLNYPIPIISSLYLGICVAPICSDLGERELRHILKLAKSKLIFCTSKTYETVSKVTNEHIKQKIVLLDENKENIKNVESLEDILMNTKVNNDFKPLNIDVDENAVLLFSSGTTGLPKGVIKTNLHLISGLAYNLDPNYGDFNENKIGLSITAFYFGFGFIRLLAMLVARMKIILLPKFNTQLYLEAIQKYRVTNIYLTPALVLFMARSPLIDNYDLTSIQEIMSGAASLGKDIQEMALKRLNMKNIRQGYGLTETFAICLSPKNTVKPGSVGRLVPGKQCKIIDMESGRSLGPNEQGEICVKGNCMKGYVDDPEATAAIIDKDGWYHTGDAGYFDQHGFIYIVDRYKELIKYNGFQVAPAEIEALLLCHPGILDCAVVGKSDRRFDELATAFVVKQKDALITEADIMRFVEQNMSRQKWLHGGVIFITNIPRNPTGKILRRVLKEQLNKNTSKL